jgi:hypothetical protein
VRWRGALLPPSAASGQPPSPLLSCRTRDQSKSTFTVCYWGGSTGECPGDPPTFPPAESDHQGTVCHCQGSLSSRRELNPSPTLACARKSVKNTVFDVDLGARCEPPMLAVAVCMMPVGCPDDKILMAWAEWASSPGGRVPPPHTWETKHCVSAVGSAVCARP